MGELVTGLGLNRHDLLWVILIGVGVWGTWHIGKIFQRLTEFANNLKNHVETDRLFHHTVSEKISALESTTKRTDEHLSRKIDVVRESVTKIASEVSYIRGRMDKEDEK